VAATSPPSSAHRSLASVGHRLGSRIWPLVCGCPFLWMNGSATDRSRHPWHIRSTCCAAARPSLPAAMAMPYGLPSRREVSPSASLLKAW